jgi:histidine triad (HIT) family protein
MNCIFCKIVKGEIPANKVKEGDNYFAFNDINPQAPTHILIIPKEHFADLTEVKDANLLGHLVQAAGDLAKELKLEKGFRVVINTGSDAGQTVFHLHLHLFGGRIMQWPPG